MSDRLSSAEDIYHSSILIVDDNAVNIALLEDILEQEGYDNYISTTDPCIVADLHQRERFDLILLDIRMPRMSGIDVLHALKEQMQEGDYLPVLVLTAQTDQQTKHEALEAGARDFLTKPFDHWEVLLRINNMLETRHYFKRQMIRGDILEQEVQARTKALHDAQLEIVRKLGRAGEYRDNETGAHVIRMSKTARIIARGLGLDERTCTLILHASPMHDVGKIGIPDRILLKPGPLLREEWKIMKTHTTLGAKILGQHTSEVIYIAAQVALNHHEKWDGSGYPAGLAGKDIPLVARIAAISDVFDALTSARPYKKPWPVAEAIAHIQKGAGSHFDPQIVAVFDKHLQAILNLREHHPDLEI